MVMEAVRWIVRRLKEPSTWAGGGMFYLALERLGMAPEMIVSIGGAVMGLAALGAMFLKDKAE